jgi:hypothetical protein
MSLNNPNSNNNNNSYNVNNFITLENKYSFFHHLLDKYLSSWISVHPNETPFVSIKIFKYDENKMNKSYLEKCEEKMLLEKKIFKEEEEEENTEEKNQIKKQRKLERKMKKTIKFKQIKTTKKVIKKQSKFGLIDGHVDVKVEEQPSKIEINDRYISDINIDDLKFNIETHDRTIDSTVEILNIRESPIINRTLAMKMPSDVLITENKNIELENLLNEIEKMDYIKMRALTDTEILLNEITYKKEKNLLISQNKENDVKFIIKKMNEYKDNIILNDKLSQTEIKNLLDEKSYKYYHLINQESNIDISKLIDDEEFYTINKRIIFLLLFTILKRLKKQQEISEMEIEEKIQEKKITIEGKQNKIMINQEHINQDDINQDDELVVVKIKIKTKNDNKKDTNDNEDVDSVNSNDFMFFDDDFFEYD